MRVLVTGANGFLGSRVARALVARGDEVTAAVRSARGRAATLGCPTLEADVLTDAGRERLAATRPEACVHAAWYVAPGLYLESPSNVDHMRASVALASVLGQAGCLRFVGVGTGLEYADSPAALTEGSALAPAYRYSRAKAGTYLALRDLAASQPEMSIAWARVFSLYGPDEAPERLVPSVARALLTGRELRCTSGRQVRDYLHVEDAGSALAALAHSDVTDAVNVASGKPVAVSWLVERLCTLYGAEHRVLLGSLADRATDRARVCADVRKLRTATDYAPEWTLDRGLADALSRARESPLI